MSEKDIKTKPKTTTKAVQNAPKAADRFAKEAVKDIKTVSKDVFIKNIWNYGRENTFPCISSIKPNIFIREFRSNFFKQYIYIRKVLV